MEEAPKEVKSNEYVIPTNNKPENEHDCEIVGGASVISLQGFSYDYKSNSQALERIKRTKEQPRS